MFLIHGLPECVKAGQCPRVHGYNVLAETLLHAGVCGPAVQVEQGTWIKIGFVYNPMSTCTHACMYYIATNRGTRNVVAAPNPTALKPETPQPYALNRNLKCRV